MKKVLVSILTLFIILSMMTIVYAATGNINLSASSETATQGKTFTVTLAGTADNNITGLQAALSFDATKLAIENKAAGANFTDASGSDSEIAILSSGSTVGQSGTLYTVTFKVLDNAPEGQTTISVTNATLALVNANSEQEDVSVENAEVTVEIKTDQTIVGGQDENNDGNNDGNNGENSSNEQAGNNGSNNSGSNNSGNTASTTKTSKNQTTKLPQTGVETTSLIAIITLGAISIASYISYKKYKNI